MTILRAQSALLVALLLLITAFEPAASFSNKAATRQFAKNYNKQQQQQQQQVLMYPIATTSPLFSTHSSNPFNIRKKIAQVQSPMMKLRRKLRRAFTIAFAALWFWSMTAPPAHAASSTLAPPSVERIVATSKTLKTRLVTSSSLLDRITDQYVREHMFQDDTYDPVEGMYREAYDDVATGTYPQALYGTNAGTAGVAKSIPSKTNKNPWDVGSLLTKATKYLETKAGISTKTSTFVLAGILVVAGPSLLLFLGMVVAGMSKRSINKTMKERYGDTYTVDATIKVEDPIETPDDDEEDEEEGDETTDDK
jgi:hypothetical protein